MPVMELRGQHPRTGTWYPLGTFEQSLAAVLLWQLQQRGYVAATIPIQAGR